MLYFSLIGGFGEGLEGQDIGFLKTSSIHNVQARDLMSGRTPYLLTIPMGNDWYLYKQK